MRFVNMTVAQAKAINLTLPDPNLKLNKESGDWEFGEINWDEFWRVVKGDGPCNRERLAARNDAHDNGAWVREAAAAFAAAAYSDSLWLVVIALSLAMAGVYGAILVEGTLRVGDPVELVD